MEFKASLKLDNNKESESAIAENLTYLLNKHHITSNQLSLSLGLPFMTVRRLVTGETYDPRVSTLKLISNYFDVSLDFIVKNNRKNPISPIKSSKTYLIPKIDWTDINIFQNSASKKDKNWTEWKTLSLQDGDFLSDNSFALESRPSMFPRYPKGTIFIIDPETSPTDGDIVLIEFKKKNEYALKELTIDPPIRQLRSLVKSSDIIIFSTNEHQIVGVSLMSFLYGSKLIG